MDYKFYPKKLYTKRKKK